MGSPKVSVIIPCFNAAWCIVETLQTVLEQRVNLEVIVVDDGSTDGSGELVGREFPSVEVISTANRGPSAARNTGTRRASGVFLQYLDADDLLIPGKIEAQLDVLHATGADIAYGDWRELISNNGSFITGKVVSNKIGADPELAIMEGFWCPPAAYLFRRSIFDEVGGWNEELPLIEDVRFVLECALIGAYFVHTPGVFTYHREHPTSLSRSDAALFDRCVYENARFLQNWWESHGTLDERRKRALANCFGSIARFAFRRDLQTSRAALADLRRLEPSYIPDGPLKWKIMSAMFGFYNTVQLSALYQTLKEQILSGGRVASPYS